MSEPTHPLAYVFWHTPRAEVERRHYEDALGAFHRALNDHPPAGFQRSYAYRAERLPWLPSSREVYEDWYLLDASAALDPLNEAAVAVPLVEDHDVVARLAAAGTAGLYRLRSGTAPRHGAVAAHWLAKPAGESYAALYARLEPLTAELGGELWCRQMVLGPTPELCLRAPAARASTLAPPEALWSLEPVWPPRS